MLDGFPTTKTWLYRPLIADGSPEAIDVLNEHAYRTYGKPLVGWYRGSRFHHRYGPTEESETGEVLSRFVAGRLLDIDYWRKWEASGHPLRNWLVRGCKYTIKEGERQTRRQRKLRRRLDERPALCVDPVMPDHVLERRLILGLVRASVATVWAQHRAGVSRAGGPTTAAGRLASRHGRVLIRCCWRGETNRAVAKRYGCTVGQVVNSKRAGLRDLLREIKDRLGMEGVPPSRIEDEIRYIVGLLGRGHGRD